MNNCRLDNERGFRITRVIRTRYDAIRESADREIDAFERACKEEGKIEALKHHAAAVIRAQYTLELLEPLEEPLEDIDCERAALRDYADFILEQKRNWSPVRSRSGMVRMANDELIAAIDRLDFIAEFSRHL